MTKHSWYESRTGSIIAALLCLGAAVIVAAMFVAGINSNAKIQDGPAYQVLSSIVVFPATIVGIVMNVRRAIKIQHRIAQDASDSSATESGRSR